jgi:hypothetical protein
LDTFPLSRALCLIFVKKKCIFPFVKSEVFLIKLKKKKKKTRAKLKLSK